MKMKQKNTDTITNQTSNTTKKILHKTPETHILITKKIRALITTRTIEYHFKKLATIIDQQENTTIYTENLKPHNLRHSFTIHALKTNEINYVKEFLGHENIATTQIYTNLKEKEIIERFKGIELI